MKNQQTSINHNLKDARTLVNNRLKAVRPYNRKKDAPAHQLPFARFKLKCWFKDGNERSFYSYDVHTINNQSVVDEWEGLDRLHKLMDKYAPYSISQVIFAALDEMPMKTTADYKVKLFKQIGTKNLKTNKYYAMTKENKLNLAVLREHYEKTE